MPSPMVLKQHLFSLRVDVCKQHYNRFLFRLQDVSVHLYEMSNRIGGRLYTRTFPNIPEVKLELGGAYYEPSRHRRMEVLVQSLGLRVKEMSGETPDMLYYIRDTFVKHGDLNASDGLYRLDAAEQHMQPRDLLKYVQLSTFSHRLCYTSYAMLYKC